MRYIYLLALTITCLWTRGQELDFASKQSRKRFVQEHDSIIAIALRTPLADSTEVIWKKAIWGIQLMNRNKLKLSTLRRNILQLPRVNNNLQRNYLEMIYGQYPTQFVTEIKKIIYLLNSTRAQAIAYEYLKRNKIKIDRSPFLKRLREDQNLDESDKTRLMLISDNPSYHKTPLALTLKAILDPQYLPHKTIVISIQRPNRDYPGLVLIKDTSGKIYLKDGKIFTVPQLARSLSNLPYYITNGNTPAGVFLMDSLDVSENKFIGPTRNVQIRLPFNEASVSDMYWGKYSGQWTEEIYKNILPEKLRGDLYLMQAYFAGKCNRTEMIAHGTTVDPAYYKGTTYYPQTPTLGCLCMIELYDDHGKLIKSDQNTLANALMEAGGAHGYYFIIETSDQKGAVTRKEILSALQKN